MKRTNCYPLKVRGKMIDVYNIEGMPETLTMANLRTATVYFSVDEPIAIIYKSGRKVMLFKKLGAITMRNRLILRKRAKYETIDETKFNSEIFDLLSRM